MSNEATKAGDDLCWEKSSHLQGSLSHRCSTRSLGDGKVFKLDSRRGSPQSTLRRQQNQVLYSSSFEDWEIPVVMFPPKNKQSGTLWVCTLSFSPCTNKTKHAGEGGTQTQPCVSTQGNSDSEPLCIHVKAAVIYGPLQTHAQSTHTYTHTHTANHFLTLLPLTGE